MTTLSASLARVQPAPTPKPRIIERNTFRYTRPDGAEVTRLHMTDIVTRQGDKVTLNSGGWRTMTTKDGINSYAAPYMVVSDKGTWYVTERDLDNRWRGKEGAARVPFYDGIELPKAFKASPAKGAAILAQEAKLRKQIARYCAAVNKLDALPFPNAGDCWLCNLRSADGVTWGDGQGDHDHLRSHLAETYVHGSLLVNALCDGGWNDQQIRWALNGQIIGRDRVVTAIRRYFKRKLGLA